MKDKKTESKKTDEKLQTAKKIGIGAGVFTAGAITAVGISRMLYGKTPGQLIGNRHYGKNIERVFKEFRVRGGGTINVFLRGREGKEGTPLLKRYSDLPDIKRVCVDEQIEKILENKDKLYGLIALRYND